MNRDKVQGQPDDENSGGRTVGAHSPAGLFACAVVTLIATSTTSVLADTKIYDFISPESPVPFSGESADESVAAVPRKARYNCRLADLELEQAVSRAAQQHHVQPALLLAVMKAESSFNPAVVSKSGAVGLMQLIPENAIRHGVRNLSDTTEK